MALPHDSNETSYLLPPSKEDWERQAIPDFVYGQKDLTAEGVQWPKNAPGTLHTLPQSPFDAALCSAWRQRVELGLFRYRLRDLQTQILPGAVGFVAQLNVERGAQRRRPQTIMSVRQAFDPEQFNFNKIQPGEVLFCLRREPDLPGMLQQEDILVVINVSPLEWGHVLLVPEPARGLPQRLLPGALKMGVEAVLLSLHPGFRVGFNSLGGLASVNHLHLHGYYLAHRLPVEHAPSAPLDPGGHLHLLQGLPAPGFLFYCRGPGPDLEALISRVCRATDYLTNHEIAHNLFVTRGAPPGKTSPSSALTGVRVILWARKSSFGIKEESERMEPSTWRTTESEEHYVEEKECEKCVKEEATIPSNSSQQALLKADYKAFKNGVPSPIIATEIPKKVIAPVDTGNLEAGRRKRRRKRRSLAINLTNCKYESVRRAAHMCGLKEAGEEEEWTVYWTDCAVSLDRVMEMKRFQDNVCMHLTNYAINKHNENFVRDGAVSSKRKLSTLNIWLQEHSYNPGELWGDIEDIIIKTIISAHPVLRHNYRTCFPQYLSGGTCACFEILGFDILLDHKLKPWLLEVNHSPSFTTDSRLDQEVKDALLCDAMMLVNLQACDKRKVMEEEKRRVKERLFQCHQQPRESRKEKTEPSQVAMLDQEQYEDSHLGKYRRIYPGPDTEKYARFFKHSGSLFQETAASKAREECARQQLEEIRLKQEQQENSCTKRQKAKDQNQGESAGEKSRPRPGLQSLSTRLVYRNHNWEKQLLPGQLDTMRPQEIVEEEELERLKALLQRETLIRSLGIVEQLTRLQHPGPHGQKKLHECRPKNFNWTGEPAAINSYSLSVKKAGRCYFSSARIRLTSQGQASRRLEAINRVLAGSVPPTLTPKQSYLLQPERVASDSWAECTLPSVVNSEHRAAKVPLCPASAPVLQRSRTLFDISQFRCGPGVKAIQETKSPFLRRAECPSHGAVAVRRPLSGSPAHGGSGDRQAWAAAGAERRRLEAESVF
ncbi:tubulin polyglutamylase TTLL13 isoform X6 [Saimiri boliviensis]|uniref:tubulin polyglutamylase TTLL13 isoform X6 n=1 Tax=Saimiri boliviensis TaxID=27679 RepID=UPI003D7709BF